MSRVLCTAPLRVQIRKLKPRGVTRRAQAGVGPRQSASRACFSYTLALPLRHMKLLNGASVSELCKLVQLDSLVCWEILFSLSPRTGMGTQVSPVLCLAEPHLLPY